MGKKRYSTSRVDGTRIRRLDHPGRAFAMSAGPRMSGPSIRAEDAEALFVALRAHYLGDDRAIDRWDRTSEATWHGILWRWAPPCVSAEDLMQELRVAACAVVKAGHPVRSPGAWLSRVALHLVWKHMRRDGRERAAEKGPPEEVPDREPTPFEVAAEADDSNRDRAEVLTSAGLLPPPYGHVLVWRLIEGLSWQKVRDRLVTSRPDGSRPIGRRQVMKIMADSIRMFRGALAGRDARADFPQRYLRRKNPWIDAPLQPIGH